MVICWGAEEISNKSVTTNAVDIVPWTSMLSMKSTGITTALLLWMRISCFQSDMTVKVFVTVGLCCCDRTVNVVSVFIKVLRVFCNVLCRFYYVGPGVSGLGEGFAAWALLIFSESVQVLINWLCALAPSYVQTSRDARAILHLTPTHTNRSMSDLLFWSTLGSDFIINLLLMCSAVESVWCLERGGGWRLCCQRTGNEHSSKKK